MLLASATEVGSLKIVDWFTNVRIITVLSILEIWFYATYWLIYSQIVIHL
jgi:hypothetical protein